MRAPILTRVFVIALGTATLSTACGDPADLCEERVSRIGWNERDRYGERPRDYVDPRVGEYDVAGFDIDRDRPIEFDITLTRRDELVTETQRVPIDGEARCDDLLEAPVRVRIVSSGNQLDERLLANAEIYPTYPDDPLRVVAYFDVDDLEGDWRPDLPAGRELEGLSLVLDFRGGSVEGELLVESYDRNLDATFKQQAFLIGSSRL